MSDFIAERGHVSVEELIRRFAVSGPTVRRDLAMLAQAGVAVRTHGGVTAAGRAQGVEPLFMEKLRRRQAAKARIAEAAGKHVEDGGRVLLDSGTTCLSLARVLAGRPVTVVALDVKAAAAAASGATKVVMIGGTVRNGYFSIVGEEALAALAALRCDVFFLAADALDLEGISNVTEEEAWVKRAAIGCSQRTILVADHTKLGRREQAGVCGWEAIDLFVTDREAARAIGPYQAALRGVEMH